MTRRLAAVPDPPDKPGGDPSVVLWFDPGLTTGWAYLEMASSFNSGQAPFESIGELLTGWAEILGPNLWVGWELYNVTQGGGKAGTPKYSLETIGMLKWICHAHDVTVLKAMPSASRKLGDEIKLKKLDWRKRGQVHANDAAMHLLAWHLREKKLPPHLLSRVLAD
jgi:hypothetical protein